MFDGTQRSGKLRAGAWIAATLLCLGAARAVEDPPSAYLVRNWTTGEGLPENTVRSVIETRDGYLWVGTTNGLARFDGVRFTTFDSANTPGFSSSNILELAEDPQGGIWIASTRGTFRFHEGRFRSMHDSLEGPPVLLRAFVTTADGEFWMVRGDALARWTGEMLELHGSPGRSARGMQLCAAREGGIWAVDAQGLWRIRDGEEVLAAGPPGPNLITTTPDGRLWGIINQRKLVVLENGQWREVAQSGEIRCATIHASSNGDVWLGATSRHHTFRYRAGLLTEFSERHGIDGNRILCFAEDRSGNLWIGTNGAGLYQLRPKRLRVFTQDDGFENISVASVTESPDGKIIANVMGWAMHRLEGDRFVPVTIDGDRAKHRATTALVPASEGGVWSGELRGSLARIIDDQIVERIGSGLGTQALFVDRDDGLWRALRSGGIEHFSGGVERRFSSADGLSSDTVYCFTQTADGAVWAGTENGLDRIEGDRIESFGKEHGLGFPFVAALCTDSLGTLWAGTIGGGLSAWNGSRFVTFRKRHGLPDEVVSQLIEDDHGNLWIGTRAGLMRIALEDLHQAIRDESPTLSGILVGRSEGIVRPDCWTRYQPASLKDRNGDLWFCTSSGLVHLDPKRFSEPGPLPIVHLEESVIDDDGEIFLTENSPLSVELQPGAEQWRVRYTGLGGSNPGAIQFRVRLEGYDRDWIAAGTNREASYSHLDPGRYTFRVQAANPGGSWSEADTSLSVIVRPRFHQTALFRAGLILLALLLLAIAYRWRVGLIDKRRRAQELFSRKLIESQETERKRIAAELHDSLGQNLLVIKNKAALALTQPDQPERMALRLEEVSSMASASLREVRDIAQNLRPFQLDELGITKSIAAVIRQCGDASGIEFATQLDQIDSCLAPRDQINFYRIVQESLNNVLKHSRATKATVTLRREPTRIRYTLEDNGRGFDLAKRRHPEGSGLSNMTERANAINGRFRIDSRSGRGTRIDVEVPLAQPS